MKDSPPTNAPPTDAKQANEEDNEVEEITSKKLRNSLSLDEDELSLQRHGAASPNKYLTIIHHGQYDIKRSNTEGGMLKSNKPRPEKHDSGPPVPPRKRR